MITVAEADIERVTGLLKLPKDAFDASRTDVLMSMEPMDVAACPGSGKTTLLIAKLSILAEKWRDRTRGICVLSHTNVARSEVENRLGHSTSGRRLLYYPHYIGTIHGFVNEFLALPWLRSRGHLVRRIDTATCQERRWARLKRDTRTGLQKNNHDPGVLSIKTPDLHLGDIRWGKGLLGKHTPTYQDMQRVCKASLEEGFHCYDEMFMWARHLITTAPQCTGFIRDRFPLLFVDEAQDNSEDQSALLHLIFGPEERVKTLRQRFGDSNQAIFDSISGSAALTDPFPNAAIVRDIPDSHRFGKGIASVAAPLGLVPQSLKGRGPDIRRVANPKEQQHTLFLFEDHAEKKVLAAYAELLIASFTQDELRDGSFIAVGQVHRPPVTESQAKVPQHVGQYWPEYSHELAGQEARPQTLRDQILFGISKAKATGEASEGVQVFAQGIARLLGMMDCKTDVRMSKRTHRHIAAALTAHPKVLRRYNYMACRFILKRREPTANRWSKVWQAAIREIVEIIAGGPISSAEANAFLASTGGSANAVQMTAASANGNCFRYPAVDPKVAVRVGSIHSVKGETHTAALILETFWHSHNLESVLPWLDGSRAGGEGAGERDKARLKLHYVGLSRPTHLLCLAMKQSSFSNSKGELDKSLTHRMEARGWQIKLIGA